MRSNQPLVIPALLGPAALFLAATAVSCAPGRIADPQAAPGSPAAAAAADAAPAGQLWSHITIINWDGTGKEVIHSVRGRVEAPNWSPDGTFLVVNGGGRLWRLPVTGGSLEEIPIGSVTRVNNDHGISPDGRHLVVSEIGGPVYILPIEGGEGRVLTEEIPSYYHGWSPDGEWLAYVARAPGERQFDLFRVPFAGGPSERLTASSAHEDGPDYSPDGRWIYFNSDRAGGSGTGDIWRMPPTGEGPDGVLAERITSDEYVDWFPHPSPDGRWLVFLSYEPGTTGHPADRNVQLRRMPLPGPEPNAAPGEIATIVRLIGGQGTINVPSWAPDGQRFAYVSYSREE
jgi:TolB protein